MQGALCPGLALDEPKFQLAGALRKERNAVSQNDGDHSHLEHVNPADPDHGPNDLAVAFDPDAAIAPGLQLGGDGGYVTGAGFNAGR